MVILIFFSGSAMIANWLTSEPVPAVVGTQINGGIGAVIKLLPHY
jgi:hypothetical protein